MKTKMMFPDYVFESSWEVCNKVGGIYTVLSTRAKTLQKLLGDKLIFIGPDCWEYQTSPYFIIDNTLFSAWREAARAEGLNLKVGRWDVPGQPIAVLIDFKPFYSIKNDIYTKCWERFKVDSLHAYGDYDEASMFSYAAAKVVESYYHFYGLEGQKVVYHGNEWMTCLGLLYVNAHLPQVATIFTTHATSIGRSIAGNNKLLYDYMKGYHGDQMAAELNMQSKHSVEKQAALYADCFTTVSDITAQECAQLLDKPIDVVLPNGFDNSFVPKGKAYTSKRQNARKRMLRVTNALTGIAYSDDSLIVSISGRYEFRNKGIDVFIDAMHALNNDSRLDRRVIAFIEVPGWTKNARQDLSDRLANDTVYDTPLDFPVLTHELYDTANDRVLGMINSLNMGNRPSDKVSIIFIPCYLTGSDGIVNISYYDLLTAKDLCVFPSYYEPWGYTPLEAVAFHVPCITTDLAGFGLWADAENGKQSDITDGVSVVHRTDSNYGEVVEAIKNTIIDYSLLSDDAVKAARSNAEKLSKRALWSKFIKHYEAAYDFALRKMTQRTHNK